MVTITMVNGQTTNKMDMVYTLQKKELEERAFGKTGKEKNGQQMKLCCRQ